MTVVQRAVVQLPQQHEALRPNLDMRPVFGTVTSEHRPASGFGIAEVGTAQVRTGSSTSSRSVDNDVMFSSRQLHELMLIMAVQYTLPSTTHAAVDPTRVLLLPYKYRDSAES